MPMGFEKDGKKHTFLSSKAEKDCGTYHYIWLKLDAHG